MFFLHMQLRQGASGVRDMVMALVGRKVAPQRTWLHILFQTISIMESSHPPVFSLKDTQQLLSRVQARFGLPYLLQCEASALLRVLRVCG